MSVVINGMEMPKNCFNCRIRKSCEHAWYLSSERPDDCPLAEECTGHWIDTGSGQECSVCGEIQYGYDNFRRFCANCGAKMKGMDEGKKRTLNYILSIRSTTDGIEEQ